MKYGESSFDILYLLFAILSGLYMLVKKTVCYILMIISFLKASSSKA